MSKLNQTKISTSVDEKGNMYMDTWEAAKESEGNPQWILTRINDGLVKKSTSIIWIEWNETGHFKAKHQEIALGRSLLMSPFHPFFFTWQTTSVTEIVEQREDYIKFKTENSTYQLSKI